MSTKLIEFFYLLSLCSVYQSIRLCPTFFDYDFIGSKACRDDPVLSQNVTELIQSWGFHAEEHYLTTEDGYKILVERAYYKNPNSTPIVIVHGIATNSLGWVNRGNVSLAYVLGKLGYDVWMVNYRGGWYSKGHVSLSTKNPKYWSFSIHELGIYDIRSTVKYVNEKTHKKALYIGYSMGTTGFLIYATTYPDEAKMYVTGMVGLAPVINYKDTKTFIKLAVLPDIFPVLRWLVYRLWHGEILPGYSKFLRPFVNFSLGMYFIQTMINLMFGFDYELMDPSTFPVFPLSTLDTAGIEVFTHYVQIYYSGVFQNYDHGETMNMKIYGQVHPPPYNLSRVSTPVALYQGPNDWIATPTNSKQLYQEIPKSSKCGYYLIGYKKFNHADFLAAKNLPEYMYRFIFDKLIQMESGRCRA